MILSQKKSGKSKGNLAYNDKATRDWISKEDKLSPTVLNESITLTIAVDAHKNHYVAAFDVPNAFIQTIFPVESNGEESIMKVCGE